MNNVEEARQRKEQGNTAYRQRDLETAALHYEAAIALDPTAIAYPANMAAVRYEQGLFAECVQCCEQAVAVGREHRADFRDIAKAMRRAANAHLKLGDLAQAKASLERSLAEHRTAETRALLANVEGRIRHAAAVASLDIGKADAENTLGNACFGKGDFAAAVAHYTSAMSAAPADPRYPGNRAAAYARLAEFQLALRDCDAAIALDPRFVKAWLRRGFALLAMRDPSRARQAFHTALQLRPDSAEGMRGLAEAEAALEAADPEERRRLALADPEVCAIVGDPGMQAILRQLEADPQALYEHMKDPQVAEKLQKLFQAGVLVAQKA